MSSFTDNVNISPLPQDNLRITTAPFCYWTEVTGERIDITIPSMYRTDAGSIPRLFQRLIPKLEPRSISCYILHDYIYTDYRQVGKIYADLILVEALWIMWVPLRKIFLIRLGLTLWGWWVWYKFKKRIIGLKNKVLQFFDII